MLSQKAAKGFGLGNLPGAFWVEYLPWLRYIPAWIPGSSARQYGEQIKPFATATRNEPFEYVAKSTVSLCAFSFIKFDVLR